MKKTLGKIFKQPLWLLSACMIIVIVFSLFANMANTSAWGVKVTKVNFDTKSDAISGAMVGEYEGNMEGLLYTPKGCDAENPCPVIVTTHGYLNSKEMQDAPAIELSKRGYIVLALDMYDHGESTWTTPAGFSFYPPSLYDAAKWVYEQDFTLKDAAGNGMIAVSGHSMGGFSTQMAVLMDEMMSGYTGHRKIAVSLSVGADFRYTYFYAASGAQGETKAQMTANLVNAFATRSSGMVIAHFDEFFGNTESTNTVTYKNFIETADGKLFLGNGTNLGEDTEYVEGKFYEVAAGGTRVIYTPYETHPWNHFSTETTSYMIDFYGQAFDYQLEKAGLANEFDAKDVSGQTWWLKEAFEFVALIALLGAVIPAFNLLMQIPFFASVKTEEEKKEEVVPAEETAEEETTEEKVEVKEETKQEVSKGKKKGLVIVALVTSLIPAYFFQTFINRGAKLAEFATLAEWIIRVCAVVVIGAWLIYLGVKMVKGDEHEEKSRAVAWGATKGSIVIAAFALLLRFVATDLAKGLKTGYWFNAPTANDIGYWALIAASISLLVIAIVHFTVRKRDGATMKDYGLKASFKQVLMALLISVILFVGIYAVVFLIEFVFNTDFRLWVYAVKSFEWHHFVSFLRYVPIYFIFYFVNSIVVASNTKDVKGWKGYAYAITLNIGGLVLLLALQYGRLFLLGEAALPSLALNGILLIGLVPSLAVAAIYAKKFAEKTNNIWTSAFFNTFLFTMIAIANTAIYLLAM